jgi:hypothetical protein
MRRVLAFLALALLLSSCSWFRKEPPPACPRLGIVADTADLIRYRPGGGHDITDQLFSAQIGNVTGDCRVDKASANVDMKVSIVGERGAALTAPQADVEYFVAVTGPGDQILAKETFRTRLDFAGRNRTGVAEELAQRIPLPEGSDPGAYHILVGFQLTPEELADNRRRRH